MATKTLAQRIASRRTQLGLSVSDVAHGVGVTIAAVMQWESGETKTLRSRTLFALADVLNVRPQWLESGGGEMSAGPDLQAFRAALSQRDKAASEPAKRAWERIAARFAKTALMPTLLAALSVPPLLAPTPAEAGPSILHNAFNTHWLRFLRRLRELLSGLQPAIA